MTTEQFIKLAKEKVKDYTYQEVLCKDESYSDHFSTFVVWQVKVLQNYKALLATSINGDQHYYEATYNGDKNQLYLDVYNKEDNKNFGVKKHDDQKYTVQVIKNIPDSFLNIGRYNSAMLFGTAAEKIGWRTHFTQAELDRLKQRDDIAIDWSKAIIEPLEDD